MSRAWKIICTIAIIAFILGALCILAGVVTGGDMQRVQDVFSAAYNIEDKLNAIRGLMGISPLN